jgi:hypothetical protein
MTQVKTDIKKICEECCEQSVNKYFDKQKREIFENFRMFARYNREINFFMDKIMDELNKELNIYKTDLIEEFKIKINEHINNYNVQQKRSLRELDNYLNKKINDIQKKEPYDIISQKFLSNLEQSVEKKYYEKVDFLQNICIFFVIINISMLMFLYFYKLK